MALSRNINAFLTALHPELRPITINTIYAHPSIQHLKTVLKSSKTSKPDTFSSESRPQRMQRLFEKYSAHSPPLKEFLGSSLLDAFMSTANIGKIYCLNRGEDARERQLKSHISKGLSTLFEKLVRVRRLIDLSLRLKRGAALVFVSSISALNGGWEHPESSVPELVSEVCDVSQAMGNAESKLVGERLVAAASNTSGRVGQIRGSTTEQGF
ncbi:hypothetical protein MMC28_004061 [Mycoblastus sanguinarius]|nr:hypothetical protein [Mycoblastus sanguinarius]